MKKVKRKHVVGSLNRKTWLALTMALSVSLGLVSFGQEVHAESFAKDGAYEAGTVTITPIASGSSVNGYSKIGGYQVNYVLRNVEFTAYDSSNGSDFYVGNNFSRSGGCSFWYAPNGNVWQEGALQLGVMTDAKSVGSATVDQSSQSVQVTYQVSSLSELPTYIGFAYQPAGGAYIHRSQSYGHNYHIWYYHGLKNTTVTNTGAFDSTAPSVSASIKAGGKTVTVGGKTWGTKAIVEATAFDAQSRPANLYLYQGASKLKTSSNTANATSLAASWELAQNGTYTVKGDDKLGNTSSNTTVSVDLVDTVAPSIQSFGAATDAATVCKENTLTVLATDAGCGLAALPYKWDDGEWSSDSSFIVKQNGTYQVTVRDALGNETSKSIKIENVDSTAPTIENIQQKQLADDKIRITVTAKDNDGGAGLHNQAYSFDGGKTWQTENYMDVARNDTYEIVVRDAFELSTSKTETVSGIKTKKDDSNKPGGGDDSNKPGGSDSGDQPGKSDDSGNGDEGNSNDSGNKGGGSGGTSTTSTDDTSGKSNRTKNKKTGSKTESLASISGNDISSTDAGTPTDGDLAAFDTNKSTTSTYQLDPIDSDQKDISKQSLVKEKGFKALSKTEKAILGVLAFLTLMGLAGLATYLLLSYLQYTCEIYAVDDKRERIKLGRFPIKTQKDEWTVSLPADKMGTTGTGEYVFVFRPTFVKEEEPCDVILHIDQKKVREKLQEEIVVRGC